MATHTPPSGRPRRRSGAAANGSVEVVVLDDADVDEADAPDRRERDTAFTAFVEQTSPALLRTAWFLCGDAHRAEELVQHALVRTYAARSRASRGDPLAYARRVLVNLRTDSWRQRRREVLRAPEDLPDPGGGPDEHTVTHDRDELVRALALLTPRQRRIVVLRHLVGLPGVRGRRGARRQRRHREVDGAPEPGHAPRSAVSARAGGDLMTAPGPDPVGHDAPSGFDAVGAPSPSATGTPSPTSAATTALTPRTLAPGVVAPSGRLSADELGQVDLGTWEGVPVWLADGELHAQTDSDGAVSASRSTDDARAELLAPGRPSRGVYVWGTPPRDDPGAVPYLWTTSQPTDSAGEGPLVVRVPTFEVAGATGSGPQWAVGLFGTDVNISDTDQIGVVFRNEDGTLSTPDCPDLAARTCMDPLPPAVATAVATSTGSAAAPSSGTGNGHTVPDAQERKIQVRASVLMQTVADASGDGDDGRNDPGVATYWHGLDGVLNTLVHDAEAQGFPHGDDGARVVELGFFTYPGFLHERSAPASCTSGRPSGSAGSTESASPSRSRAARGSCATSDRARAASGSTCCCRPTAPAWSTS